MSALRWQQDHLLTNTKFYSIPKEVPGRVSLEDFIRFKWDSSLYPHTYDVVVESLDLSGPTNFRKIGKLSSTLELPHVKFASHAKIGVLPQDPRLPSFWSELVRGATYIIPNTNGQNGEFAMELHGVIV